jgi:hypothetical protein
MSGKKKMFNFIVMILALIILGIGCNNTNNVSLEEKNKMDNYLKDTVNVIDNKLSMGKIKFVSFSKGDADTIRDVILNYNSDYNNNTIGKEVLEYSKEYFKTIINDAEVQKLMSITLTFQLKGVDEGGRSAKTILSVTVTPAELKNVNWDTLTMNDLQKISHCILDPTQPA